MTDLAFFLDLETRVWSALAAGDPAADRALLAADFLGVYATGYSDRHGHTAQLEHGPTVARYALGNPRLMTLAPGLVLLAYRAEFLRTGAAQPEAMYVSSIWQRRGTGWLNIFSQDSAESDIAPV